MAGLVDLQPFVVVIEKVKGRLGIIGIPQEIQPRQGTRIQRALCGQYRRQPGLVDGTAVRMGVGNGIRPGSEEIYRTQKAASQDCGLLPEKG